MLLKEGRLVSGNRILHHVQYPWKGTIRCMIIFFPDYGDVMNGSLRLLISYLSGLTTVVLPE